MDDEKVLRAVRELLRRHEVCRVAARKGTIKPSDYDMEMNKLSRACGLGSFVDFVGTYT